MFLDGRELAPDANPTWMGYSTGKWRGDTFDSRSMIYRFEAVDHGHYTGGHYTGQVASPVPAVLIQIDENPNCAAWDGQVFQPRTPPRAVSHVRCDRGGAALWCEVTAMDGNGQPCPALAGVVDDSGDGACYLVFGGEWGLRLKAESAAGEWDLRNPAQWGLPFLLLPGNGTDLRFR